MWRDQATWFSRGLTSRTVASEAETKFFCLLIMSSSRFFCFKTNWVLVYGSSEVLDPSSVLVQPISNDYFLVFLQQCISSSRFFFVYQHMLKTKRSRVGNINFWQIFLLSFINISQVLDLSPHYLALLHHISSSRFFWSSCISFGLS